MVIFTSSGMLVNCAIMAMLMLYTHSIGNQLQNTMVVFKMHDSVPSARYSPVCNVLCLWIIWLIPTYRVYPLYDSTLMLSQYVNDAITLNDVFLEKTPF